MAVEVHVRNFQALKNTGLEISGFTAITGPNNSGKTALMRAIRGVFQNTPGTSFVRMGEDSCKVEIRFADGNVVVWEKGPKVKPTYTVNGTVIHPGRDVPEEVRDLGVVPVLAGGRDHWPSIAPQIVGQVFLLDQPGSVIAEAIADVERVGHLNRAMKASESDRRKAEDKLRVRRGDLEEADTELEFFDGLDGAVLLVDGVEATWDTASKMHRALTALHHMDKRHKAAVATVKRLEGAEAITIPEADEADAHGRELAQLRALSNVVATARTRAAALEGVELIVIPTDLTDVEELAGELESLTALNQRVASVREELRKLRKAEQLLSQELAGIGSELNGVLLEIGECPTCGKEHQT